MKRGLRFPWNVHFAQDGTINLSAPPKEQACSLGVPLDIIESG